MPAVLQRAKMAGFSLAFAFCFLAGHVNTMKISVAEFPGHVQMCPERDGNLLKPVLTCKCLGANFFLVINVVLLDLLDPLVWLKWHSL